MGSEIDKQRSKKISIFKEKSRDGFIRRIKVIEDGKAGQSTFAVRKKRSSRIEIDNLLDAISFSKVEENQRLETPVDNLIVLIYFMKLGRFPYPF